MNNITLVQFKFWQETGSFVKYGISSVNINESFCLHENIHRHLWCNGFGLLKQTIKEEAIENEFY